MSGEIEVPETPNWLQELEAKRERRLKARLGHEAGAGAPCLKCGDKCPGLDLHFWRKCCKICKCSKEEHEVQDDDIYGWAQFQLLGSKPNKIKRKIVLPGKKDEVELDWIPKGHNDTVDKYLKTLPPEQLPVKGSQAAQDRKQLLQKQIPVHDIDPTLCHELSTEELSQMNDYIAHVKQTSVGVGQIVSLSNLIKANLHMLNPSEAALIASRYPKGIPLSEIVKLQSQSKANALKQQGLNQKLDKLNLQDASDKTLPNFIPNSVNMSAEDITPWVTNNVRDVNYPGYTEDINQAPMNAQFTGKLKPSHFGNNRPGENVPIPPPTLDERFVQNPNFDPKNVPSQFIHQSTLPKIGQQNVLFDENSGYKPGGGSNSAFAPYNRISSSSRPGEKYLEANPTRSPGYSSNLPRYGSRSPSGYRPGERPEQNVTKPLGGHENAFDKNIDPLDPNFAKNLAKYPSGHKGKSADEAQNFGSSLSSGNIPDRYENVQELSNAKPGMPNYVPGKYNVHSETLSPTKIPRNVRDLAFSTYDPTDEDLNVPENVTPNGRDALAYENYPQLPPDQNSNRPGSRQYGIPAYDRNTGRYIGGNNNPPGAISPIPGLDVSNQGDAQNNVYDLGNKGSRNIPGKSFNQVPGGFQNTVFDPNVPYDETNTPYVDIANPSNQNSGGLRSGLYGDPNLSPSKGPNRGPSGINVPYDETATPYADIIFPNNQNSSRLMSGQYADVNLNPSKGLDRGSDNAPYDQYNPTNPGDKATTNDPNIPYGTKPVKKLSELHPGKIDINEDYLLPSQVTIGAIQDISYPEIMAATQGTNDFYEDYSPDSLREILNNVKLPDCHYCKKPFEENEFAITIDRANVLFHAQCFKCAGCNQILADNVYFYNKETDNVYCGRDYAKIRGFPRCKACDELIFTKEYCLAENSTFHLKHFCCIECDKPLAGQDYTLEDSMPYCLPCFEQSKASKCSSCDRVIKPDEVGCNLNGVHFHAVDECFACKVCKKPLMGKKLLLRNEKLYCSHDCFNSDKKL